MKEYSLYTYTLYKDPVKGENGDNYYIVIVTAWTDKTETASEKGHKRFYISGELQNIAKYLESLTEKELETIYKNAENTRFSVSHREYYELSKKGVVL